MIIAEYGLGVHVIRIIKILIKNYQPVRLAGLVRCWFVKKYCWLVWCERKILFRLEIYDRLRPSEQTDNLAREVLHKMNSLVTVSLLKSLLTRSTL